GANLDGADLTRANLYGANLTWANLTRANLDGADLTRANLYGANLARANLKHAEISDESNITGEPWKDYLEKVLPALLTAGGKTIEQVVASGSWDCHTWQNCPMHEAFGIDDPSKGPLLLRPRIEQFVQLFDAGLIPCPVVAAPIVCPIDSTVTAEAHQ
ncbi:MAG: pentapeptide repeat-containing protein, partial [Bradyrhizobium sp.]|nr:pentapeptide repeat-containing protein [Bradyrhizobium sp.]